MGRPHIAALGADIVKQVGCVYAFEIREKKGGAPTTYTIDLKNGNGSITEGIKPDSTFVMLDADFIKLAQGKLKAQDAFMQGKMKIRGNMKAALKLKPEIFPKDAKM